MCDAILRAGCGFARPDLRFRVRPFLCLLVLVAASGLGGCSRYSFSGASLPADLQTLYLAPTDVAAASPVPTLGDDLTRLLTERFIRQTRLALADEDAADARLDARLDTYRADPTAVTGDDRATRTRVTVGARIVLRYRDETRAPLLDRTFTAFADYDPVAEGPDGEAEAARVALRALADDAFTAATSTW